MKESKHRRFAVDGESYAHGGVTEYTRTYDRDDIIEGVIQAVVDDSVWFELGDEGLEVSDYLTSEDMETIEETLTRELLDDDYGDIKHFELITNLVESMVGNVEAEFDYQEFR